MKTAFEPFSHEDAHLTMELVLLLLVLPAAHSVKHTLTYFLSTSSGLQTFPDFMAVAVVDGVEVGYCDHNDPNPKIKQDWAKEIANDDPQHLEVHRLICTLSVSITRIVIELLNRQFSQFGGIHVLQEIYGCELDDDKDSVGFDQFGYDGEDFTSLDQKTQTWVFTKPSTARYKHYWQQFYDVTNRVSFLTNQCPQLLKEYLKYGNSSLQRNDPPSVSLLQTSPSSPVSCHATGFYPDRAEMFWRKDGEEIDEDVDHGEILPNTDGTFQINVDLNISSVKPEDWSRYDCVFFFSGLKDDIITKLDKAEIRTNWDKLLQTTSSTVTAQSLGTTVLPETVNPSPETPRNRIIRIIIVVVGFVLLLVPIAATVFLFYKKKASDRNSKLFKKLHQEAY